MLKETHVPAVQQSTQLVNSELEALIAESGAEGLELVSGAELTIPRLAILQPTSPLSQEEGFQGGHIVNTNTKQTFGRSVNLVSVLYTHSRTQWEDNSNVSSPIECRSSDAKYGSNKDERHGGGECAKCSLSKWVDNKPPLCTDFMNLLSLPFPADTKKEDFKAAIMAATPVLYSAKRTSQPATKELLTMASMLRISGKPAPLYAAIYQLTVNKVDGAKGTYWVPKFTSLGMVPDSATYLYLRKMYQDMLAVQDQIVARDDGGDAGKTHEQTVAAAGETQF